MKKELKKLIAGIITSVALCLPVSGITASTTTASAYVIEDFAHLEEVFAELSEIDEHSEFDPWFQNYWENNYHRYPNASKLEVYSALYAVWHGMHPDA